jgi:hypothetical protein
MSDPCLGIARINSVATGRPDGWPHLAPICDRSIEHEGEPRVASYTHRIPTETSSSQWVTG